MAAGLGFKTFTTGEVLTAADTNGYLMQGVNVFASAAARTAAITSPQEGQMSYLKDTNSTEYYSGSAWVAVGGATNVGMTLISTTTIGSAVSSITLADNTFTSTYDNYKVLISLARSTASSASGAMIMRYRASGTDNSAAQYNSNGFESRETTLSNIQTVSATSQIIGYLLTGGFEARTAISIDLFGINLAKQTSCIIAQVGMDGGTRVAFQRNGWHNVETAYDSLTIYPPGTLTNGRISVYGYNN